MTDARSQTMASTDRGFSLVELVVILVLVGIVSALVIPRFESAPITVGAQADQLATDIRYAQALAMTRGARYCLYLGTLTNGTSYAIRTGANCATTVTHPATGSSTVDFSDLSYTATNLSTVYIEFDTMGRPTTISPVTSSAQIVLNGNGESRTVAVSGVTGRVVIQ